MGKLEVFDGPTPIDGVMQVTLNIDVNRVLEAWIPNEHIYDDDDRPTGPQTVKGTVQALVAQRIADQMLPGLRERLADGILMQVREAVAQALDEGFQPTNEYGAPRGEPTSLREMIVKQTQQFLTPRNDHYSRQPAAGSIDALLLDYVAKTIKADCDGVLKEVRQKVVDQARATSAAAMSDALLDISKRIVR